MKRFGGSPLHKNSPVIEFLLLRLYPAPMLKLPLTPAYAPVGLSGAVTPPPMFRANLLWPSIGEIEIVPSNMIANITFLGIDYLLESRFHRHPWAILLLSLLVVVRYRCR